MSALAVGAFRFCFMRFDAVPCEVGTGELQTPWRKTAVEARMAKSLSGKAWGRSVGVIKFNFDRHEEHKVFFEYEFAGRILWEGDHVYGEFFW